MYLRVVSFVSHCWGERSILQSVNDSRNVTQDGQEDVDEEICATSDLKEDT